MTDEKFTFIEDVREKKRTATGAHHRRTHCGKGGAIRFPSDFKTKKELRAMNGEVKSYKLNDPMSWAEFKAMPDDIKRAYITALRKRYNVSDRKIADMMGTEQVNLSRAARLLGIKSSRKSKEAWDEDGWCAWVNGVQVEDKEEVAETVRETEESMAEFRAEQDRIAEEVKRKVEVALEKCDESVLKPAEKCDCKPAIPGWGQMELEGGVEECAKTLEMLLADKRVKLAVSWTVVE